MCFYTGRKVLVSQENARQQAQNQGFNTEHIWPQSKFSGQGNAYSDLHHLRPTHGDVNQSRNNFRFGKVDPDRATDFWRGNEHRSSRPSGDLGEWSMTYDMRNAEISLFEPRNAVKGDVARAMFYFYTMYEEEALAADRTFFPPQMRDLLDFHTSDPADATEIKRSYSIARIQDGKVNPFVMDSSLVRRAFFTDYTGPETPNAGAGKFEAVYTFSGTADCETENPSVDFAQIGVRFGDMSRTGVECNTVSNAFNSRNWPEHPHEDFYVGFTATADAGKTISLDAESGVEIVVRRSNTGPKALRMVLLVDGTAHTLQEANLTQAGSNSTYTPALPHVNEAKSIEFRLYASGASSPNGTLRVSRLKISGKTEGQLDTGLHETDKNMPVGFVLHPAYPNPFNPSTTIRFELDRAVHIHLSVHDVTGRQVATLVNNRVKSGTHTAAFHAGSLASGMYLVRLQTENRTSLSQKIMLLK